jgi:hypothetical protein
MLPENLHQVAPASLIRLDLSLTNVTGTLPKWTNWTTIEVDCFRDSAGAEVLLPAWQPMG